jgi:alpha-beta hydrolase superfamily lysophospholipase
VRSAPLASADGTELYTFFYPPPDGTPTKGAVLYLHGYGEHVGRHTHVCERLAKNGLATLALDYRGHGRASGRRGHCDRFDEFLGDALTGWGALGREVPGDLPRFFVAHSHGALITLRLLTEPERLPKNVRGAVLSSPFLGFPPVPALKALAGRAASLLVPTLALPSGLDAKDFTHDEAVVAAWRNDSLVHHVATARWFTETAAAQEYVLSNVGRITLPTIWLWGEADKIVDASATAHAAPRTPQATLHPQPGLFHEIFNEREPDRERILVEVDRWIASRL